MFCIQFDKLADLYYYLQFQQKINLKQSICRIVKAEKKE